MHNRRGALWQLGKEGAAVLATGSISCVCACGNFDYVQISNDSIIVINMQIAYVMRFTVITTLPSLSLSLTII